MNAATINKKEFILFSDKYYLLIKPEAKSNITAEFKSCLNQIQEFVNKKDLSTDLMVKQTIFINAGNNKLYQQMQSTICALLRNFFNTDLPPTSFIAQAPEDDYTCAVELVILKDKVPGVEIERKKIGEIFYTVIYYPGTKEVYAGGLTTPLKSYDPMEYSQAAFEKMRKILKAEQLAFSDVVRQWNYIENIVDTNSAINGILQNYQIFNDVRSMYYAKAEFCNGFPAATGIGMKAGGIILEFIAVSKAQNVSIIPIKNPQQVNAYSYSDNKLVGRSIDGIAQKASPKFERAKFIAINKIGKIYVSGTAAIRGEESVGEQSASDQTIITIENIEQLISKATLSDHKIPVNSHLPKLSHLRVYIKYKKDFSAVKSVCEKYYSSIPILYLISDICRDDLLVELEGVAE